MDKIVPKHLENYNHEWREKDNYTEYGGYKRGRFEKSLLYYWLCRVLLAKPVHARVVEGLYGSYWVHPQQQESISLTDILQKTSASPPGNVSARTKATGPIMSINEHREPKRERPSLREYCFYCTRRNSYLPRKEDTRTPIPFQWRLNATAAGEDSKVSTYSA